MTSTAHHEEPHMSTTAVNAIVIRRAELADVDALAQLAALDSTRVPAGELLLAEVDGELRAALAIESGVSIADPFFRTAGLVALLEVEAKQAGVREPRRRVVPMRPRADLRAA